MQHLKVRVLEMFNFLFSYIYSDTFTSCSIFFPSGLPTEPLKCFIEALCICESASVVSFIPFSR